MSLPNSVMSARDLKISFDTPAGMFHAVRGIDLDILRGQTLCIVGESGCGKSVTALSLLGLLPRRAHWEATSITFDGAEVSQGARGLSRLRGRGISMIFQEPMSALNPTFSIGEQLIDVALQHKKCTRTEARKLGVQLLDRVGIREPDSRMRQFPHQLSGGQRQRVVIAMALMCEPKLLIADEPTTALDVTVQADLLRLLLSLQTEFGLAILFITHDLGVVSRIANSVAVMYAGEIVERGAMEPVLRSPQHPYTRGLIDSLPREAGAKQGRLSFIQGSVPSLVGEIKGCAFVARCNYAEERCTADIQRRTVSQDHSYLCVNGSTLSGQVTV